jgi:hypothetical protein
MAPEPAALEASELALRLTLQQGAAAYVVYLVPRDLRTWGFVPTCTWVTTTSAYPHR